jgi:DNA ligase-associated metallophosphoesterase
MTAYAFALCGAALTALPSGALWWQDEGFLAVSDLHLGKSERVARRGGTLLPPYEVTETLGRLDADIAATGAATVLCLGDSFDDLEAADLAEDHVIWLARLMAGRHWIWVEGNHDPGPLGLGGTHLAEHKQGPLTFRHIASPGARAEVSGHYHPKIRIAGQSRRCFLRDEQRLILPAYGTYTGGLDCGAGELRALVTGPALAIMTGARAQPVPLPR